VIGFFHSHPDHPSRPSSFDLKHAWPYYSYLIVSVVRGEAVEARSFRLAEDRSQFEEETVEVLRPEPRRSGTGGGANRAAGCRAWRGPRDRPHLLRPPGRTRPRSWSRSSRDQGMRCARWSSATAGCAAALYDSTGSAFGQRVSQREDVRHSARGPPLSGDTLSIVPSIAGGRDAGSGDPGAGDTGASGGGGGVPLAAPGPGARRPPAWATGEDGLPPLSQAELLRYSRHLILPEVGLAGQRRIKAASVLLVGAGGLGSPLALYLAAAGVGRLGLVDLTSRMGNLSARCHGIAGAWPNRGDRT
jgi:hypothetical protein